MKPYFTKNKAQFSLVLSFQRVCRQRAGGGEVFTQFLVLAGVEVPPFALAVQPFCF